MNSGTAAVLSAIATTLALAGVLWFASQLLVQSDSTTKRAEWASECHAKQGAAFQTRPVKTDGTLGSPMFVCHAGSLRLSK